MPSNKATAVEGDEGVLRSPGGYRPGYRPDRRSITGVGAGSSSLLSQSIPSIDVLETQSRSSTESVNSAQSLLEAEVAPPTSYFRQILSLSQSSDARIRTGDYDSIELEDQSLNQRARASAPLRLNRESMVFWRPIDTSMSFLLHQCQRLLAKTRGHEFLTGRSPRFPDVIEDVGRCMLRTKSSKAIQSGRQVDLDLSRVGELVDQRRGREYISNSIRSSRYSIWSFFPRQLVAQFSKVANFYFLIVATLQLIPNLSTTGTWTTFIPLMVFVGISMAKEGFDDVRRYRLDREENNSVSYVMNPPTTREGLSHTPWRTVKWKDIKVGDVVKLERDKPVPADIIVLHVQRTTGNIAHVETMALDGETSLKCRKPSPSVAESCKSLQAIQSTKFRFTVEDPNLDLLQFNGFVTMGECKEPLTNDHIIYRGSILRNTSYAIGLVIYTGEECKVRMNANKRPRIKAPSIQALVNKVIILVGILVSTLAITCTLAYTQWFRCQEPGFWYLRGASVALGPEFFSFFIMFNTMIPLSLYMSLEVVKLAQVFLLNDVDMYDEETDTPLQAHTSTINEELGQVKYIFSDKTGTLTKNQMEFRKLSVAGETYVNNHNIPSGAPNSVQDLVRHTQVQPNTLLSSKARMLFLGLVLCHTCVPESDGPVEEVDFQGISPDEIALLRASKTIGYTLKDRQRNALTISIRSYTSDHISPRSETYELLDVIEFSSTRKRMSVIVRLPNQQICLFCKGADNVVLGRLRDAAILKVNANGAFPFPKGKDNRSSE